MRTNSTKQFVDQLPKFANILNSRSLDRLFGASPVEISADNQHIIINSINKKQRLKKPQKGPFLVGDLVRIQIPFVKSSDRRFSTEIFRITEKLDAKYPILYRVEDLSGQDLNHLYYSKQLAFVSRLLNEMKEKSLKLQK